MNQIIYKSTSVPTPAERLAEWAYKSALSGTPVLNNFFKFKWESR